MAPAAVPATTTTTTDIESFATSNHYNPKQTMWAPTASSGLNNTPPKNTQFTTITTKAFRFLIGKKDVSDRDDGNIIGHHQHNIMIIMD